MLIGNSYMFPVKICYAAKHFYFGTYNSIFVNNSVLLNTALKGGLMKIKNDLPLVLYRFDHDHMLNKFVSSFKDDFELLVCSSDLDAEAQLKKHNKRISAIVVEQDLVDSSLFALTKLLSPQSLRIVLHRDIALAAVVSLLEQGAINRCFASPYDCNVIRSEIYATYIGVNTRHQFSPPKTDKVTIYYALIVDDEKSATKYLKKQLERLNCPCEIIVAADAYEALQLFEKYQSSLAIVLTDQRMPGMLGNQLLTEIRNHNPNIIRILTSAFEEVDVALNAVNEGQIFRYIRKPWHAQEVCLCIESALSEFLLKNTHTTVQHSLLVKGFQEIKVKRKSLLVAQLCSAVDTYAGEGTLGYFFDCLENIDTLPPTAASLRASKSMTLESELVSEFSRCILLKLANISKLSGFNDFSRQKFYQLLSENILDEHDIILPHTLLGDNKEVVHSIGIEIIMLLKQLFDASSLTFSALELERLDGVILIKTKIKGDLPIYKHILSAHTKITRQMIEQQCAMLLLIAVCRHLAGNVIIDGGKQMFSLTLLIPDTVS